MRIFKIVLIVLVMSVAGALSISCGRDSDSTAVTEEQLVTVQRGDLAIDITAVGNLAFSHQEELTFGGGGTIGEVLVEAGDRVEEGQVLAVLDDTSVISLQEAVAQAEINLEQAKINLENAEENLEEARNPYTELDVAQAEAVVANAKVALEADQEALEEAENLPTEFDIIQAELAVINAEIALDRAQKNFDKAEAQYEKNRSVQEWERDYEQKQKQLAIAEFELIEAEEALVEMMAGADPLEVEQKQKQLAVTQVNLEEAEDTLAEIQAWIEGAVDVWEAELKQLEIAIAQAALGVDTAQAAQDEAEERLEMVIMVAPFAGIVTVVNVEAGDTVNANQMVIELVDRDKFEAEILVGETDILNVRLGAEASIQVDSISGMSLPAQVTFIAPTATIQQGVVNYRVKVEIQSRPALMEGRPEVRQETRQGIAPGEFSERIKQAIAAGRITQQQAEEMMERIQEGEMPLQPGGRQGEMSLPSGGGQLPMIPEDFQLREGLTVTVSIILEERNDALLVPNAAITRSGGQTYVKVLSPDGIIEDRLVTTGISDWQYTEVTEGLSEGDKIVVPETTSTTPVQGGQGGIRIPGMGGFGR